MDQKNFQAISPSRPDIPVEALGQVSGIRYKARDKTKIPAVLTLPAVASTDKTKNYPAIIMPHGGPRHYDSVDFDWMAQYFASRGYLVLQPNFRGSSGFGVEHMFAGNGEWGGKMQDDVTDGLDILVKKGYIDPDRVCIMGGSYGGYSALAGGAFTPDKYKCVVAIAAVADLLKFFKDRKRNHFRMEYWKDMIGDPKKQKDEIAQRSPVNHADKFQAPVLLIHGKDDEVVLLNQSQRMSKALKKAGKSVDLLVIKDEGHFLLESENRLKILTAAAHFIEKHIGENRMANRKKALNTATDKVMSETP